MIRRAELSPDGLYRYRLWRRWVAGAPRLTWCLLNPSTADAERDDPTVRRCVGFARRWDYGAILIVNLYALRATNPRDLRRHPAPQGPRNPGILRGLTGDVICGWGAFPVDLHVLEALRESAAHLMCVGLTSSGAPRHPLRLSYSTLPAGYRFP